MAWAASMNFSTRAGGSAAAWPISTVSPGLRYWAMSRSATGSLLYVRSGTGAGHQVSMSWCTSTGPLSGATGDRAGVRLNRGAEGGADRSVRSEYVSGTCLTSTTIFIRVLRFR
jgi:hypothetical protein